MKKNTFKKLIVLSIFSFILLGQNFVFASTTTDTQPSTPVVTDTTAPVITLVGNANVTINVGDTYKDAGATALDDTDGDITSSIVTKNNVDTTKAGTYTVTYDVKDKAGNSATTVIRNVNVVNIPTLKSIAITTPATKLSFVIGDPLNIDGLVVTGTYDDGSAKVETITTNNITGFDSSKIATNQVLTITIGGETTTYAVNIIPAPVTINLKIYAGNTVLFDGPETVTACVESPAVDAPITVNGKCAIEQSKLSNTWTWKYSPSGWLDELGGYTTTSDFSKYWSWFNNLTPGTTGLNQHLLSTGEELLLTYNSYPLRISASKNSGAIGDTVVFTAEEESTFDSNYNLVWTKSKGVTVTLGTQSCATIADGTCSIILNTSGSLNAIGTKDLYVPTDPVKIEVSNADTTAPVITLVGNVNVTINVGDTYKDAGSTALDDTDGDITSSIVTKNNVDTTKAGTYTVTYDVKDKAGNSAKEVVRSVTTINPVISSGGGGVIVVSKSFSIPNAISFLAKNEKPDGSFGNILYTDWVALAVATSPEGASIKSKVSDFLKNNPLTSTIATDNERHAMALMSLGINPYSGTSVDYIKKITDSFDGTQIGDSTLLNDDIFALIVLSKAGYTSSDSIISKDVNYLISKQSPDGSWSDTDLTSAAVQALNNFKDIDGVQSSVSNALNYLSKAQGSDGGFGNSFSTSWALQAFSTNTSAYNSEIVKADKYLALQQQSDGGVDDVTNLVDSRVWSTSYAIPAALHLSWNNILQSFSKPVVTSQVFSGNISSTISNNSMPIVSTSIIPASVNTPLPVANNIKTDSNTPIASKEKTNNNSVIKVSPEKPIIISKITKIAIKKPTNLIIAKQPVKDNNTALTASAANASSSESLPYRVIKNIIYTIEAPFIWLFVHLGF
ncbi:MAG: DUF5011 domain-containing protein [Patescibacteria group bacterium]|nr:DUF5011 domain-containing protein [Patescibacteria group bacterium]